MNFLNCPISFSGKAQIFWLCINDDKNRIWTVSPDQLIDCNIILMKFGSSMVPADNLFSCWK